MKQNKLFLGLATMFAAAFAFTSCSSEDAESQTQKVDQNRTIRLVSTLEKGGTRSVADPQDGTSLSTSSDLAIWAINTTADPDAALENGNNEQYSVNNSGNLTPKTTTNTMTWPEGATLDFYAYAPYNSGYSYYAANNFSVQTDQSTVVNYLASDLVLAQATNKTYNAQTPVALQFKHLLSKINITINLLDGSNVSLEDASVTIMNTKIATTFTPNAAEDAILGEATGDAANITAVGDLDGSGTACAVLVPQTISAGTELVQIVAGTNTLIAKLGTTTTLESGKSYSFTVNVGTVDDTPAVVTVALGVASITEWNSDNNNLGAVTFPRWYATFGTPGGNASYNAPTYGWTATNNNLMQLFSFEKGELANYKTLKFTISNLSGNMVRMGYYVGETFTEFGNGFGSNGTKTVNLTALGIDLSTVTSIAFGGRTGTGTVDIIASECYLSTEVE